MNKGWLELESDPGLFTLLLEDFGVNGVQVEEIYDLQKPIEGTVYGFIFLFRWIEERRSRRKTNSEVESFVTDADAVNKIFFAQQIIPNSCATHALLSVLLNCDNKVKLGKTLNLIKEFTDNMSPEDKGYAIANMPELARVHNSFARPETSKPVPEKQAGLSSVRAMDSETFHFVSYVPIHGHLFELDGLKPHPIDHGPWEKGDNWTEKFRCVISDRLGMATGGEPYHDIRFNLMAVVPDKRQLLEHKLVTLKTNRNIVLEALQQVVSPTSSERSDSEVPALPKEAKKNVTFARDTHGGEDSDSTLPTTAVGSVSASDPTGLSPSTLMAPLSTSLSHPTSILKGGNQSLSVSAASVTPKTTARKLSTEETISQSDSDNTCKNSLPETDVSKLKTEELSASSTSKATLCESAQENEGSNVVAGDKPTSTGLENNETVEREVKLEPMDSKECTQVKAETSDAFVVDVPAVAAEVNIEDVEVTIKSEDEQTKVSLDTTSTSLDLNNSTNVSSDVTKPLSIETKFGSPACAASSESTDTASEAGSGFSSPGSLNTSSSQSSPQFSDGNNGATGEGGEERSSHRRKRKSSHAFTPKDLLYLLKNVENEIELCETNLKEENEKRKKYKIDACRRTHNYDQFIVTFLSMLAEQGLLGELMEQNISGKRPGGGATGVASSGVGNSASNAKVPKKAAGTTVSSADKKKKPTKIKKRGKR